MRISLDVWSGGQATERDRTADLTITNRLLYQLSYGGVSVLRIRSGDA